MNGQYILIGQTPSPCDELLAWAYWMETNDRRVRLTQVGEWFVTTVFLGLDHNHSRQGPPLLFETMAYKEIEPYRDAFGFQHYRQFRDDICERCAAWLEAEAQHELVVGHLLAELWKDDQGVLPVQIEPEPIEILTTIKP